MNTIVMNSDRNDVATLEMKAGVQSTTQSERRFDVDGIRDLSSWELRLVGGGTATANWN